MPRYNDRDLFKKLNKEKPLIKQMDKGGPVKSRDLISDREDGPEVLQTSPSKKPDEKEKSIRPRFREYSAVSGQRKPVEELKTDMASKSRPEKEYFERPRTAQPGAYGKTVRAYDRQARESEGYGISDALVQERKYRHELKYYINERDYEMLKSAMSSLLLPDMNAKRGGYHVRSLYFDDYENSALQEKIDGVYRRKKYRIRIYHKSEDLIRLERKLKNGEFVSKDSLILTRDEYEKIINNDIAFLLKKKNQLAHDFYIELKIRGLRPVTVVDYYREAFVHQIEDVRITFDSDLRSAIFDKDLFIDNLRTMPMYEDGLMVLEVKYNDYLPRFIRTVLNNAEYVSRSAVSKYIICRKYD